MGSSARFYNNLPEHPSFDEAFDFSNYHDLPQDWFIVVVDVINSSKAIEAGHYKQVNTIGAAVIMAAVNINRSIEIPFTFGGDGATFAMPRKIERKIRGAMRGIMKMARAEFGLDLRVAVIPVEHLNRNGFPTRIKKIAISSAMSQVSLFGDGWMEAENLTRAGRAFAIDDESGAQDADLDLSGLACHWSEIESRHDHKLCILVQSLLEEPWKQAITYKNVMLEIKKIYGSIEERHPLSLESIKSSFDFLDALSEARAKERRGLLYQLLYALKTLAGDGAGWLLFWKKNRQDAFRKDILENCDFRKFDGMLRLVLDGTEQEKDRIESYLEEKFGERKLVYGLHASKKALMTCVVFSYEMKKHAHFIDGTDGGYALAAMDLKSRLKTLEETAQDHSKQAAVVTAPPSGLR